MNLFIREISKHHHPCFNGIFRFNDFGIWINVFVKFQNLFNFRFFQIF
nr:MAG TPA: hypothetical protein [Caudoviricetes sp.]